MKTIALILVYLGTFFGLFFALSAFGTVWVSYHDSVANISWFVSYTMLIGWWVAMFPAVEYYNNNLAYFKKVFA